jgi:MFS family permease
LSRVFSLRRYLLANTVLFLLFSVMCGQVHSLGEMIFFRALQGFAGGVLIPLRGRSVAQASASKGRRLPTTIRSEKARSGG